MSIKQLFDLSGRTALITGGSRGLGLQIAEALGEMGARVAITARKADELESARAHLAKLEVKIWLEEMIPYLDRIELAGAPTRLRSNFFNGIKSLPVITVVAMFTGMILALQTGIELRRFGQEVNIGAAVMVSNICTIPPVNLLYSIR